MMGKLDAYGYVNDTKQYDYTDYSMTKISLNKIISSKQML